MLLLAFDTAGTEMTVALGRDGAVLDQKRYTDRRGQGEALLTMAGELLQAAGAQYPQLAGVVVTTGPGSFTGLRLGLAAAEGLQRALGCRAIGVDRFTLAWSGLGPERVAVVLDSLRDELFVRFGTEEPALLRADAILARASVEGWALAGDGVAALGEIPEDIFKTSLTLDAAMLIAYGTQHIRSGAVDAPLEPYYLRAPDVTLPRAS